MTRIIARSLQYSKTRLIFFLLVVELIASLAVDRLVYYVDPTTHLELARYTPDIDSEPLSFFIIMAIIVLPLIETLVFQIFLLRMLKKATFKIAKSNGWLPAFWATSLAFAAYHSISPYAPYDVYHGFLITVLILPGACALSLLAIIEHEREKGHPFASVFLLHALHNIFVLVSELLKTA